MIDEQVKNPCEAEMTIEERIELAARRASSKLFLQPNLEISEALLIFADEIRNISGEHTR